MVSRLYLLLCVLGLGRALAEDGGKAPRIPLNDGNSIPAIGLGTWLGFDEKGQKEVKEKEVENAVKWALEAGYRMIDTAALYRDEDQVGKGVAAAKTKREDVFVVTKLGMTHQRDVLGEIRKSLQRLNMEYVDLYLIHFPIAFTEDFKFDPVDYLDTWKQMEEAKKLGLAKSIGVSNFNASQIQRILDNCEIKPAVNQIEINLNLAQTRLVDFCKEKEIVVMAYTPFGSVFSSKPEPPPPRSTDPILVDLTQSHKKTTAQIVLRYLHQRGVVPIPKSVRKERIEENIDIFDFELTPEEMELLGKFDKGYRTVWPTYWQDHPYFPFERADTPLPNPFQG